MTGRKEAVKNTLSNPNFIAIRVRKDNLVYLFFDEDVAFSVDSIAPQAILHALSCEFTRNYYLESEILELEKIKKSRKLVYALTTHHHKDHSGGNKELKELSPDTIFISYSNMQDVSLPSFTIKPVHTPCHTSDSVCYLVNNVPSGAKYVLTGDFLFKLGCGKFFEGSAKVFNESLSRLLKEADDSSIMLCGHDYYAVNKRFTEQFYPVEGCEEFFSTLKEEKQYNPFFNPQKTVSEKDSGRKSLEKRLEELRELKDNFE